MSSKTPLSAPIQKVKLRKLTTPALTAVKKNTSRQNHLSLLIESPQIDFSKSPRRCKSTIDLNIQEPQHNFPPHTKLRRAHTTKAVIQRPDDVNKKDVPYMDELRSKILQRQRRLSSEVKPENVVYPTLTKSNFRNSNIFLEDSNLQSKIDGNWYKSIENVFDECAPKTQRRVNRDLRCQSLIIPQQQSSCQVYYENNSPKTENFDIKKYYNPQP